jgi:hypothetical protein
MKNLIEVLFKISLFGLCIFVLIGAMASVPAKVFTWTGTIWQMWGGDVVMTDGTDTIKVETNGGLAVNLQDQTSDLVDYLFHIDLDSSTLSEAGVLDSSRVTVTSTSGAVVGHLVRISCNLRYYEAHVLSISDDTIFTDTPLDTAFPLACVVNYVKDSLNVDGSGAMIIGHLQPPAGVIWHITRIIAYLQDGTAMDDAKFGGISALTNGCVLRVKNGKTLNVFNVKSNGDWAARAYDAAYADNAPAGSYGFRVRRTFGGQSKNGVVIELDGDTNDELEILIQDDLTDLEAFNIIGQGHVIFD